MATSGSQVRGIDPSVAVGLPPDRDASPEDKGRYTVARFAAQNDHFTGPFKTWTKTLNFLIGEQWRTHWDGTSLSWTAEQNIPDWRQQPVTNYTYAVYRTALAKLTKQKPTLEVVPPSGNSEDREAAELCHALLTYLWRLLRKSSKFPTAVGWILVTGQAWLRVGYDPNGGQAKPRTIPVPRQKQSLGAPSGQAIAEVVSGAQPDDQAADFEEVEVAADEQGEPYRLEDGSIDWDREPDKERTGEIDWSVVSPLAVRLNPEATGVEDATEMYVATLWPKNKAAKHFGVKEEDLGPGDESAEQRALYEDLVSATAAGFPRSWSDRSSSWGVSQETAIGNRTLVIEFYSKPDDDFDEGRHWITAGMKKVWPPEDVAQQVAAQKKVVTNDQVDDGEEGNGVGDGDDAPLFENGEAPLPFGFWPPLIPIFDTPIPGQPSSVSLLSQVVPLNEQANFLDGKIAEKHVVDAMGGATIVSPEDKDIKITSEPGQVIPSVAFGRRGQAFAPYQMKVNPLPDAVYKERDVAERKIQVISGMSGNDLAQRPQGVPSGRALLVTQETSDSVLMPLMFAIEAALEESGRRELIIAQQKYREERTIAIRPTNGKYLFRTFKNTDLRDGHDIRVEVGSSFAWSKSAQWDSKVAFLEAVPGLYTDPVTMKVDETKLARLLDVGAPGLAAFETEENPDLIEIEREHLMFENYDPTTPDGSHQIPQIAFWQTHPIHLQEHYNFMKRDRYRFEKWHPAAKEAFKAHMMLTMAAIEDAVERVTGADGGAAGDGGNPDTASAPGAAPPGSEAPAPGAKPSPSLQLVKPGGGAPGAKLTPADRASAKHL